MTSCGILEKRQIRSRSLESVRQRFRKITSIQKLQWWENYLRAGGSRSHKLHKISEYTLTCFTEALEKEIIIHDTNIAR